MQATFLDQNHPIRIDFHEPSRPASARTPALILAHGSGGDLSFWFDRLIPFLNQAGVALYAPLYFDRTQTVRADLATITDGIHAPQWIGTLEATLRWVADRPKVDPQRIAFVGISLGSFLSLALAAQNSASPSPTTRSAIRALVDISGGLVSPYGEQATSHFPPTLILHGQADNIVPVGSAAALDRRLTQLQVAHETRLLPNEGHWFSAGAQMQLLLAIGSFLSRHL